MSTTTVARWTVWDNREQVATFSTEKRAEINGDAYTELIELVTKYGNQRLKDQMWALVDRTREKTTAALAEFKSTGITAGGAR